MMKILLTLLSMIFSLPVVADDRATIERHLQEKEDMKTMKYIFLELEDRDDAEVDSFINAFIDISTKQGREYLKNQVLMRLYMASIPKKPTGKLLDIMHGYGVLVGEKAPDFALNDSTQFYDMLGKKTLLYFYEHSCTLCKDELNELHLNYDTLTKQDIQVISVDCNVSKTTRKPWPHNIIDPVGKIYYPYGILATPSFILLDKKGTIIGKYNKYQNVDILM